LGRNSIKKLEGLDQVAATLEELWLSYNQIEKLNGIESLKKLKVLYCSNNKIKDWGGIQPAVMIVYQAGLMMLEDVLLCGNPVEEKATSEGIWVQEITKRLPYVKKLDGKTLIRDVPDDEKVE
jgi:dynein light chain 1, axonemal